MKKIIASALILASGSTLMAQDFVVIGKDTKVFEQPVAKDEFAALNQKDEAVMLLSGMAYKVEEQKGGWYIIEYSPGLRGMVMQNVLADPATLSLPSAGSYKVANNPAETVTITITGDDWNLKSGDTNLKGIKNGNVVYFNSPGNPNIYTLVKINNQPKVFNYSNSVTKFF